MDGRPPARWIGRLETLLAVILAFSLVAAAALVVVTVASVFVRPAYGVDLVVPDAEMAGALRPGARLWSPGVTATVSTAHGSIAFAGLYLLTWLPGMGTTLIALWGLVRVLRRGRFGDRSLFAPETVAGLRRVAAVLIVGSLLTAVLSTAAKAGLAAILLHGGGTPYWPGVGPAIGVVAGLGLLAVAEIIRRGLVLLTDLEGTI